MELTQNQKEMLKQLNALDEFNGAYKAGVRLQKMVLSCLEYLPNPDRRWYQFWKPKRIRNPDYQPEPFGIDIVRGKKIVTRRED